MSASFLPDIMFRFSIDQSKCTLCGRCVRICEMNALEIKDKQLFLIVNRCNKCQACIDECESEGNDCLSLEVEFYNNTRTVLEAKANGEEQLNEMSTNLNCIVCNRCG